MGKYLVGMDAGTTGCKVCVFDLEGNLIGSDYREYPCYYPNEGWVEQIPEDIKKERLQRLMDVQARCSYKVKTVK